MYMDQIEAYQETPGMTAMGGIPGLGVGLVFNQQRAGRTIMSGVGRGRKYRNTATVRAGLANTLRPANWSRFGSYDAFYHRTGKYSPYAIAGAGNFVGNALGMGGAAAKNPAYQNEKGKAMLFGRGTLARMGAMSQMAAGQTLIDASRAGFNFGDYDRPNSAARARSGSKPFGLMNILTDPSSSVARTGGGFMGMSRRADARVAINARVAEYHADTDRRLAVTDLHRMAGSVDGFYSQKMLNYYAGTLEGRGRARSAQLANMRLGRTGAVQGSQAVIRDLSRAGLDVVDGALTRGGQRVGAYTAIQGAKPGARMAAAKVVGARGLGAAAGALGGPFGTAVFATMLAYDLGQLGGAGIKAGINLVGDAAESIQGSIQKPIFGMGFKDTQFAATSRARGVMAIQNSRLNARSAIGSEAGMMAAHFG